MINKWANQWAKWSMRRESEPITNRVVLQCGVWLLTILAAIVLTTRYPLALLWVGMWAGGAALLPISRRLAYQRGFHHGRWGWLNGLAEAQKRGMSPDEWLSAEMERATGVTVIEPSEDS